MRVGNCRCLGHTDPTHRPLFSSQHRVTSKEVSASFRAGFAMCVWAYVVLLLWDELCWKRKLRQGDGGKVRCWMRKGLYAKLNNAVA
ncbi:unnamed protein product [Phaeothamnion confervicola]